MEWRFRPLWLQTGKGTTLYQRGRITGNPHHFDQYVHTDMGANGLAKYLANHGINKIQRQNGKNTLFDAALIRRILKNPVYCGKIAYGRRRTEKVHGTRNDYKLVEQDDYLLVDGLHEAIVSEELWHEAQDKTVGTGKEI